MNGAFIHVDKLSNLKVLLIITTIFLVGCVNQVKSKPKLLALSKVKISHFVEPEEGSHWKQIAFRLTCLCDSIKLPIGGKGSIQIFDFANNLSWRSQKEIVVTRGISCGIWRDTILQKNQSIDVFLLAPDRKFIGTNSWYFQLNREYKNHTYLQGALNLNFDKYSNFKTSSFDIK